MKCSTEMLQNLPYFWNKKHKSFLLFSFRAIWCFLIPKIWQILKHLSLWSFSSSTKPKFVRREKHSKNIDESCNFFLKQRNGFKYLIDGT